MCIYTHTYMHVFTHILVLLCLWTVNKTYPVDSFAKVLFFNYHSYIYFFIEV